MKRRSSNNMFFSKKQYKETMAAIRRNDVSLKTASFHMVTFKQLKLLNEYIQDNSHLLNITIPSMNDASIYGIHRVSQVLDIHKQIENKMTENRENTFTRNQPIVFQ